MKRLVILNPVSRHGRAERDFARLKCERWLGDFDLYLTRCAGDATDRVKTALLGGECDQILVAGGDGSVNEAARGYWESGRVIQNEVPLGVINLGTGGDFYKTLQKTSPDYQEALIANRFSLVDLGKVGEATFLNIASVGMGGEMLRRLKGSRFQAGAVGYLYHTLRTLVDYKPREVEIEWVDECGNQNSKSLILFNLFACNGCYSGGGMEWAPGASLADGLLRVTVISGRKKLPLVLNSKKVYSGKIENYPGAETFAVQSVIVRSESPLSMERDGEIAESEHSEVQFEVVKGVFPLVL